MAGVATGSDGSVDDLSWLAVVYGQTEMVAMSVATLCTVFGA